MLETLAYFNEDGQETRVVYELGIKQSFLDGFSRGVKWKYENKEVSFFVKNTIIKACPCIHKPFIILIYTGFNSYERVLNYADVVNYQGHIIKRLGLKAPESEFADTFRNEIHGYRYNYAFWEKAQNEMAVYITAELAIRQGWIQAFEKRVFDEETLEVGTLVKAWREL